MMEGEAVRWAVRAEKHPLLEQGLYILLVLPECVFQRLCAAHRLAEENGRAVKIGEEVGAFRVDERKVAVKIGEENAAGNPLGCGGELLLLARGIFSPQRFGGPCEL